MMSVSDDIELAEEGPIDDPKVTQGRHRCIVLALMFIAACAIAAIIVPLVIKPDCDCEVELNPKGPTVSPGTPTAAPTAPGATPAPTINDSPTAVPTTLRLGQFINAFLIPRLGEEVFEDMDSPHYRAAEFISDEDEVAPDLENAEQVGDRYALVLFYYATNGDNTWFTCFKGDQNCTTGNAWLDPQVNHCQWFSIVCNDEGRVTDVFFATAEGNGLSGDIPNGMSMLSELGNFVAVNNLIKGTFPADFSEMSNLRRVILSENQISGEIPDGFLSPSPLEILMLSDNQIGGTLPQSIGSITTLRQLLLANNGLSGPIPSEVSLLGDLTTLDLSGNKDLSGSIPDEIYTMSTLENLLLDGCGGLQGSIPSLISGMAALVTIRLGDTGYFGSLPSEIFDLPTLSEIDLTSAGFSGTLSEDFAKLALTLQVLKLSNNAFTGAIPSAFDVMIELNILELEGNNLSGEISGSTCALRGEGRTQLQVLTVDCAEVSCSCCTNCNESS